jgi:hypothetical protein
MVWTAVLLFWLERWKFGHRPFKNGDLLRQR